MSLMKSVFQNEGLLLLRNKFLAIPLLFNVLCWGYIIISYEIQPIHFEERAAAFYQGFIWLLFLNLLFVGLLAVYMASKDRESEFEQLIITYNVKNTEWIIGKWMITQLYGLCITIITIVVQAIWFIRASMTLGDWFKNIVYVFIQMEGAFILLISIGFLFAILIKSLLAYLVIPAFLVMNLFLPFDYTGKAARWDNPMFHLFTPFDFMFVGSPYDGIWGIHHVFKKTILHQIAVGLLGIVILIVALLLFRRNRRSNQEKKLIPILIVIFLIPTILLSGMRINEYERALHQYITTGQRYVESFEGSGATAYYKWKNSFYEVHKDDKPYEFTIEKTNLRMKFQIDDKVTIQSNLTIKNNGNKAVNDVFLTLYHGLSIRKCTSEKSVTCSRDGDFINLHFEKTIKPNETFDLNLHYKGEILQYRDDGYLEQAFIKKERVYLPKEAGWYPLIGKRPLVISRENNNFYTQFELRNARLVEDFPTEFTVHITRKNRKVPLALTIPEVSEDTFKGTSQYGLSLIGGNFKEYNVRGIRVITHPEVLDGAKNLIERYQKAWSFVENWLGVQMSPSVIYILNDNYFYQINDSANYDYFVMRSKYVDDMEIGYELMNGLTREEPFNHNQDFHILSDVMVWMILNHLEEQVSFEEWSKSNSLGEGKSRTLVKLLQRYKNKGSEPFKDVLKYLFDYWIGLENKQEFDMEAAIKQYEGDSK